jgi:predicted RND superfamily exporter protein
MAESLPADLPSKIAQEKVQDTFGSSTLHMMLIDKDTPAKDQKALLDAINKVDGVNYCMGMESLTGSSMPSSMIPSDVRKKLESDKYTLAFVSTEYYPGSVGVNKQIDEIEKLLNKYDKTGMLIGEAPLTHDLVGVTNIDFRNVNSASLIIIFVIILLVFRSISLPLILELVIEFAIFVNMAVPYFTGQEVSFVTSIILGTVQLGSTVDYAILMTSRYQRERQLGFDRHEAVRIAHSACMGSIITSGVSFFAATFGVAMYSNIDIIQSICMLLARGALISTAVVIFILPGMFVIFDPLIVHTSLGFLGKKKKAEGHTPKTIG